VQRLASKDRLKNFIREATRRDTCVRVGKITDLPWNDMRTCLVKHGDESTREVWSTLLPADGHRQRKIFSGFANRATAPSLIELGLCNSR